jgi:hypothetical protein
MLPPAIRSMVTPEKRNALPEGFYEYGPAVLDERPYPE